MELKSTLRTSQKTAIVLLLVLFASPFSFSLASKARAVNTSAASGIRGVSFIEGSSCMVTATFHQVCGVLEAKRRLVEPSPYGMQVSSVAKWKDSAAGDGTFCFIDESGTAFCSGKNTNAALGDGTTDDSQSPRAVSTRGVLAGVQLSKISTNGYGTCAVSTVGKMYCWGESTPSSTVYDRFYTGTAQSTRLIEPKAVIDADLGASGWRDVQTLDNYTTCAITDLSLKCFGASVSTFDTAELSPGERMLALKASSSLIRDIELCVLGDAGNVYCNGAYWAQDVTQNKKVGKLARVLGVSGARSLYVGPQHACAITTSKSLYCWGRGFESTISLGVIGYPVLRVDDVGGISGSISQVLTGQGVDENERQVLVIAVLTEEGAVYVAYSNGDSAKSRPISAFRAAPIDGPMINGIDVYSGGDGKVGCLEVKAEVDSDLEPTSLTIRASDNRGSALVLENESPLCTSQIMTGTVYTITVTHSSTLASSSQTRTIRTPSFFPRMRGDLFGFRLLQSRTYQLSKIFRVDSPGTKKWTTSGNCRTNGKILAVGPKTRGGFCRVTLRVSAKGRFVGQSNSLSIRITSY